MGQILPFAKHLHGFRSPVPLRCILRVTPLKPTPAAWVLPARCGRGQARTVPVARAAFQSCRRRPRTAARQANFGGDAFGGAKGTAAGWHTSMLGPDFRKSKPPLFWLQRAFQALPLDWPQLLFLTTCPFHSASKLKAASLTASPRTSIRLKSAEPIPTASDSSIRLSAYDWFHGGGGGAPGPSGTGL